MPSTSPYLKSNDAILNSLTSGPYTLATWFRPKALGNSYTIMGAPTWALVLEADGTITWTVGEPGSSIEASIGASLNSGTIGGSVGGSLNIVAVDWNFIAMRLDTGASIMTLFLNDTNASLYYGP